ncbi:hypothetical protein EYF80_025426 [Liparis tanakae]|uniref:Uncharacterized protein n=1 Tax=Liparis tanakae TaxID=230148 RepID=A0A4Z2HGL4_9TELE|nr:hypothetical protein EYF80_025426 [Liparis tanakae]
MQSSRINTEDRQWPLHDNTWLYGGTFSVSCGMAEERRRDKISKWFPPVRVVLHLGSKRPISSHQSWRSFSGLGSPEEKPSESMRQTCGRDVFPSSLDVKLLSRQSIAHNKARLWGARRGEGKAKILQPAQARQANLFSISEPKRSKAGFHFNTTQPWRSVSEVGDLRLAGAAEGGGKDSDSFKNDAVGGTDLKVLRHIQLHTHRKQLDDYDNNMLRKEAAASETSKGNKRRNGRIIRKKMTSCKCAMMQKNSHCRVNRGAAHRRPALVERVGLRRQDILLLGHLEGHDIRPPPMAVAEAQIAILKPSSSAVSPACCLLLSQYPSIKTLPLLDTGNNTNTLELEYFHFLMRRIEHFHWVER